MGIQTTNTNQFPIKTKTKFHHNKVVLINILITLLLSLGILGYAIAFNNNSTVLYSSTFTNSGQQNTIQIQSNYNTKIHFNSLCNKDFKTIIQIQISSQKGTNNYSFEASCSQDATGNGGDLHTGQSYFVSGNYNLTINYNSVKWIDQNIQLFTLKIQEYHGSLRDIQLYDNLVFPFGLLSGICFISFLFYGLNNETWGQMNEIDIIKRVKKADKEEYNQKKSRIDCRIVKIPGFIKDRRLLIVLISYVVLILISAGPVGSIKYLLYSIIIISLIIYESMPNPNIDYIEITYGYISFTFRTNKIFILEKERIRKLRFELGEIESLFGSFYLKGLILESKDNKIYYLDLNRKLEELVTLLYEYNWIEEEERSNGVKKIREKIEPWKKKVLRLYYYNPVICDVCKTNNDLLVQYCKKCGVELQKKPKYDKSIIGKAVLLLSVYILVDIPVLILSYVVFNGFMKTIYIDYDFFSSNFPASTAFNVLSLCLILIAIGLFIIQTKLFGKYLPKMVKSKATAEYSILYIGVPILHGIIFVGICMILRYYQFLYLFVIAYMIFMGECFLFVFSITYRFSKIMLKFNYLPNEGHYTKEERIRLVEEKNRQKEHLIQEKKRERDRMIHERERMKMLSHQKKFGNK